MAGEERHTKQELIEALREEFGRWERLLNSLSEEQVTKRDLAGGLSVKDVVAHLWAWQQLSVARLEAAIDNRAPEYQLGPEGLDPDNEENLEKINAWIHETNLDRTWVETYGNWRSGFLTFVERAEAIPEKTLMQPRRYPWLKDAPLSAVLEGAWDHHQREHYVPLAEELRKRGMEF